MTTTTTVRTAATLAHQLPGRIHTTCTELNNRLHNLDSYPPTASGANPDRITGGGTAYSPVEQTVIARLEGNYDRDPGGRLIRDNGKLVHINGPQADLEELADLANTLLHIVNLLHRKCDQVTGKVTRADIDRLRCKGTGDADGATCTQLYDPRRTDGRCVDCGPKVDARTRRESDARRARRYADTNRR
jgi:hypothetical protein